MCRRQTTTRGSTASISAAVAGCAASGGAAASSEAAAMALKAMRWVRVAGIGVDLLPPIVPRLPPHRRYRGHHHKVWA
jgi:hypothetical protein